MTYSFSSLKAFSQCPLRAKLIHKDGHKEPTSSVAKIGLIVAEMMAEIRQAHYGPEPRCTEPEERAAMADLAAQKHRADEAETEKAKAIIEKAIAASFSELFPSHEIIDLVAIEHGMAFDRELKPVKGLDQKKDYYTDDTWKTAHFKAKPDFVWRDTDGVLHVEDDKSGWGEADPHQLLIYAWAARENLRAGGGLIPVKFALRLNYLAQTRFVDVSADEINAVPDWIKARIDEIEAMTEFPATPGAACNWCGFIDQCPHHAAVVHQLETVEPEKFGAIKSIEQAQKAASWIFLAERCISAAKSKARDWVEEHGPVAIPGTDKVLRLTGGEPVSSALAAEIYPELVELGIPRHVFFERVKLGTKDVEEILKGMYPLAGKGVDANVKSHNKAQRARVWETLSEVWTKSPRAASLKITKAEEYE